ncbi:MAG: hypothetical protein V3V14_01635 [Saprospiraceae bacterium]
MKNIFTLIFFLIFGLGTIDAQDDNIVDHSMFGLEMQVYPTGLLPGIRYEKILTNMSSINLRIAAQLINHRNLGKHDSEKGYGYGVSIAYRRFLSENNKKWSLAIRNDYWKNFITSINYPDDVTTVNSETTISVIQPTLMLEYAIKSGNFHIVPSLAVGFEWNVKTVGEPTGEGAIILLGCCIMM